MKIRATLFLLAISFTAVAQQYSFHQEIDDDGKRLKIKIDIEEHGRSVHYSNTFNVNGMSKQEKEELVSRTLDSVKSQNTQEDRHAAQGPRPAKAPKPATRATTTEGHEHTEGWGTAAGEATASAASTMEKQVPFQKSIEEDTVSKRIKVRYEYFENGEEHIFERTINTEGRTEREIRKLLEETEKSLGLTQKSM